jgi:hypothetical protein
MAVTYFKFAAGRGRRYTETKPAARPWLRSKLQPVGSRRTSMLNSGAIGRPSAANGGQGRTMRNKPWRSSSECESASACGKLGQFDPSLASNSGSATPRAFQTALTVATDNPMPSAG